MMSDIAWELEHSVEADAGLSVAWNFWTNVANWDDPPAEFELEGRFAAGSRGMTRMPGQQPMRWIIREVTPHTAATIEMALDGATLSFEWHFDELSNDRTRLTQRVILRGPNAGAFVSQIKSAFSAGLSDGMVKIAKAISKCEARGRTAD